MTSRRSNRFFAAIDATWPAHRIWTDTGWTYREGRGGGKRVSATTQSNATNHLDPTTASQTMRDLGQPNLFMIRPQDQALDETLARQGFAVIDPVVILHAKLDRLPDQPPSNPIVMLREPDAAMADVWASGGIGTGRLDIMRRCNLPKTCILLCVDDTPAAVAFVALAGSLAMAHAVEVLQDYRGKGYGKDIMYAVLNWSRDQGATEFGIITTRENTAALGLYHGLGLSEVGYYHYRIKQS